MVLRAARDYGWKTYRAIEGGSFREKTQHLALTIGPAIGAAALYHQAPNLLKKNWVILLGMHVPIMNNGFRGLFASAEWIKIVDTSQKLLSSTSIADRVFYGTIAVVHAQSIIRLCVIPIIQNCWKTIEPQELKPIPISDTINLDLPHVHLLQDAGFTNADFWDLAQLFDPLSDTLQTVDCGLKRAMDESYLRKTIAWHGGCKKSIKEDLITCVKYELNLDISASNEPIPPVTPLQRRVAAAFNATLWTVVLGVQLKYQPASTLVGLVTPLVTRMAFPDLIDQGGYTHVTKDHWLRWLDTNIRLQIPAALLDKITSIINQFISLMDRTENTAFFSPASTTQRCHQIWNAWINVAGPALLGPHFGGWTQGLNLISYYNTWCEYKQFPSPTEI